MPLPSTVRLVEVSPRDGLQNEPSPVPLNSRLLLIEALAAAGVQSIECGSFVSPGRVPQMAVTPELFSILPRRQGVTYSALVPNLKGLTAALEANVTEIAVFVSASEQFSQANLNCSVAESLRRVEQITIAADHRVRVRAYISCVLGCPYEGVIDPKATLRVAETLRALGCYEISLGDTIGIGTPAGVQRLLDVLLTRVPASQLAVHFHDTWGQALVNIYSALQYGISVVDASVAGLGGCPYAPGSSGNVASEDVVYLLHGLGIETGIDLPALAAAGNAISAVLGHPSRSRAAAALAPQPRC